MREKIIIYAAGACAERFLIKHWKDVEVVGVIDGYYEGEFYQHQVYRPNQIKQIRTNEKIIVCTDRYQQIRTILQDLGLQEFKDFIPYGIYKKKIAIMWGNCNLEYMCAYMQVYPEFYDEYGFYYFPSLWDITQQEIEAYAEVFRQADLLLYQPIRINNRLGYEYSTQAILSRVSSKCKAICIPNLYSVHARFMFPQAVDNKMLPLRDNCYYILQDTIIDQLIEQGMTDIQIQNQIETQQFWTDSYLDELYEQYLTKLENMDRQGDIHIADYILSHLTKKKLFLDWGHPDKTIIREMAKRTLQYMGYENVKMEYENVSYKLYGYEMIVYPTVAQHFHLNIDNNELKNDNTSSKIVNVTMNLLEYIKQYRMVYEWNKELIRSRHE